MSCKCVLAIIHLYGTLFVREPEAIAIFRRKKHLSSEVLEGMLEFKFCPMCGASLEEVSTKVDALRKTCGDCRKFDTDARGNCQVVGYGTKVDNTACDRFM